MKEAKISFEKAFEKLENIVKDLEAGNLPLEDLIKKYEEGVKLAENCQTKLDRARERIELLTKKEDGSFEEKDFEEKE